MVQNKFINSNQRENNDNIQADNNSTSTIEDQKTIANNTLQDHNNQPENTTGNNALQDHNNCTIKTEEAITTALKSKAGYVVVPYTKGL